MPTLTDHAHEHRVTRAEFEAFRDERDKRSDGARYELLDGEILVTPAPSTAHQRVVTQLVGLLWSRVGSGIEVLTSPFDVILHEISEQDTVLQPDLLVARSKDLTDQNLPAAPVLAVEVLSPSTWRRDLGPKRDAYAAAGVEHYWVVAPNIPSITVYRLGTDGSYREEAHLTGDQHWTATAPVEITLCPADLVR